METPDFIHHFFHGQPALLKKMLGDFEETVTGNRLNRTERRALIALLRTPSLTATALAGHLSLEKGGLTPVVKRLIRYGYLKQSKSVSDGRAVSITLTADGRRTAEAIRALVHGHIRGKVSRLSASDRKRLASAVQVLHDLAEKWP